MGNCICVHDGGIDNKRSFKAIKLNKGPILSGAAGRGAGRGGGESQATKKILPTTVHMLLCSGLTCSSKIYPIYGPEKPVVEPPARAQTGNSQCEFGQARGEPTQAEIRITEAGQAVLWRLAGAGALSSQVAQELVEIMALDPLLSIWSKCFLSSPSNVGT